MLDDARLTIRKGNYRFGRSGAVADKTLLDVATQYENDITRKFVAMQADQLAKRFTGAEPVLCTVKYDGEGVFFYYQKGQTPFLFNAPSGGARVGLPCIESLAAHLEKQGVQRVLLRSELYLPQVPGEKRLRSGDVNRTSHQGSEQDLGRLKLAVFDAIMLDGKDLRPNREDFAETWQLLEKLAGTDESKPFHRPSGTILPSDALPRAFEKAIAAGEEGLVIRRLQRLEITKVKPDITVDAVVIGYVEGEFEGQYGVTSLLTALNYPGKRDGALLLQTLVRAGSGLTDEQRVQFLELFAPLKIEAPLPMTDSDGRSIHFVKPEILVELRGEDLTTTSRDREHRTQVFAWDGKAYRFKGLAACPRLTFATFRQLRSDKSLDSGGARIEQILKDAKDPEIHSGQAVAPCVIRREVYVKADAVRKLIVTKQSGEEVMPYLVMWVDYSAKRKDPLKITTQVATTEARASLLAEKMLADGVTKGFVKSGESTAEAQGEPAKPAKKGTAKKKAEQES